MADAVYARFDDPHAARELSAWWIDRLVRLAHAGAAGFRLIGLDRVPAAALSSVIRAVREEAPQCGFFGWTPGVPWAQLATLRGAGLDRVFASTAWWDGRASWLVQEYELLRRIELRLIERMSQDGDQSPRCLAGQLRVGIERDDEANSR